MLPGGAKLIIKPIQLSCKPSKKSEIQRHTIFFNARTQIVFAYGFKSPLKHSRELQHGRGRISIDSFSAIKGPSALYFISDLFQENDLTWWVPGNQVFFQFTQMLIIHEHNHQSDSSDQNKTNLYPAFLKSSTWQVSEKAALLQYSPEPAEWGCESGALGEQGCFLPEWISMCCFRFWMRVKRTPHVGHWKGLSGPFGLGLSVLLVEGAM